MRKRGFTLVEIMTALSIFLIIMTISMGSIVGIFDANRKSRSMKTVMLNLNLALETMSREIRFGKNYRCGSDVNCPEGGTSVGFLSFEGKQVVYRFNSGAIEKSVDGEAFTALTSEEVVIEDARFFVMGASPFPDLYQPRVIMNIKGRAGTIGKGDSSFSLQTYISQRYLDNL